LILLLLILLSLLLPNYLVRGGAYVYKVLVWLFFTLLMVFYASKMIEKVVFYTQHTWRIAMLIDAKESCLVLVDVQEKLTPLIHESEKLIQHCQWLLKAATMLNIPTIAAEQYPKGLGHTVPALKQALPPETSIIEKTSFSCASDENWSRQFKKLACEQAIIMGIETHVCVLQTAIELLAEGLEVFVVADAVSSRHPDDHRLALERMNGEGVVIVTREMVVFEWLQGTVGTDLFRQAQKELFM
ncbi:MAG: hydrolase, partial [Gammaproteobacteria bacterium]